MPPEGAAIAGLGRRYSITMGAGLAISLVVILVTLPLLRRMTGPASVRLEQVGTHHARSGGKSACAPSRYWAIWGPAGRQRLRGRGVPGGPGRRARAARRVLPGGNHTARVRAGLAQWPSENWFTLNT
jgi:hypothetical protein